MMRWLVALALALELLPAAAECYRVDGGSVRFEAKQTGAPFRGTFHRFGGELCLQLGKVTRMDAWLEPASVDTGLPEVDAALKGKEFFDATTYPRIAFTGSASEPQRGEQRAHGTLEIKGRRRAADVPFQLDLAGGRPAVAGSFTLNRLDYGIGTGEWADTRWLGPEVRVEFSATLAPR
jgi:polyisoprenoid-binding protein YceI